MTQRRQRAKLCAHINHRSDRFAIARSAFYSLFTAPSIRANICLEMFRWCSAETKTKNNDASRGFSHFPANSHVYGTVLAAIHFLSKHRAQAGKHVNNESDYHSLVAAHVTCSERILPFGMVLRSADGKLISVCHCRHCCPNKREPNWLRYICAFGASKANVYMHIVYTHTHTRDEREGKRARLGLY